jgi:GT2 family glycosyltransferase
VLKFSIIIPVKSINDYVRETIPYIQALKVLDWELFIIPNNLENNEWSEDERISIIKSGHLGPADKRDIGAQKASGDILVFLDDDSYPKSNILEVANKHFISPDIIAVGGPGITPSSDSFWQKVSGAVFLSKYTGGSPERYVSIGIEKEIDDWPSVNLMVRRDAFLAVGGFDCQYWPGEDTKLCLKLKNTGKRLIYEPQMIVYHHRRAGLGRHLKQVGAYGLHRGFFAKKYPNTSFKLKYFLPSLFAIFFILSIPIFLYKDILFLGIIFGWIIYIIILIKGYFDILKYENLLVSSVSLLYILPTHLYYGVNFIYGYFLKKNLKSKLR